MPTFLDPQTLEKLLEGQVDILTPAIEAEDRYFAGLRCPKCRGSAITQEIDKVRPFSPGDPLPQYNGRCLDCRCLFASKSGIVLEG